jgi:general secretion pathway protein B
MSLILDALNRAERERRNADNRVPDLQTIHVPAAEPAQQKSRNNVWIILLPVVLVITIAVVWFWQKQGNVLPAAVPAVVQQEVATAEQRSVPEVTYPEPATLAVSEAISQAPETIIEPQPQPQPQATAITETAASVEITETESDTETTVDELAALYATADESESTAAPTEPQSLYEPEPEPLPVIAAQETSPPASTSLPPAMPVQEDIRTYESLRNLPDIGDLPWSLRQEIPSINYARHNYEGGQPSVLINGRAWQTGALIAPDLKLEEIYSDGVIMSFRQVRFKLRALNSWINM